MAERSEDTGIAIPLRSFIDANTRLSGALDADARAVYAREMATRVVAAAGPHPVAVVTSAPEVVTWAASLGCDVVPDPGSLDRAAAAGRTWARGRGCTRIVVAHADLPLAASFDAVTGAGAGAAAIAVIVPDRHDDGTPVLSLPVDAPFAFAYGPGSAARHAAEARRIGLGVRIVRDANLAFDIDTEADLDALVARRGIPS
jgi:2-phospho-L-lactate guanylyltransferase